MAAVRAAPADARLALIRAHPDLAGKAARAGTLTADSTQEQASVGLDRLSEEEFARFHQLNDAYKAKFGIPFIVCVRRHTKDSILRQFERRLAHGAADEHDTALDEIFRIAALRLDQKVERAGQAQGQRAAVDACARRAWRRARRRRRRRIVGAVGSGRAALLVRTATNRDGRTDKPLYRRRPVPIGTYELRFAVGRPISPRAASRSPSRRFSTSVPIRFSVAEPEGHYHVPLVMTPWSYATYRGS